MSFRSFLLFACVLGLLLWVAESARNQGASSAFSENDANTMKNFILSHTTKDWPNNIHNVFHVTRSLVTLGAKVPNEGEVCSLAKDVFKNQDVLERLDAESIYHAAAVIRDIKCAGVSIDKAVVDTLRTVIEDGDSLTDFYYAASALLSLRAQGLIKVDDADITSVISKVVDLMDEDGTFRASPTEKEGSLYNAGLAMQLFAEIWTNTKLTDEDREQIESLAEKIDSIVSLGNEEDEVLEFENADETISPLATTSTVLRGLDSFAGALQRPVDVTATHMTLLTEYLLRHKHVSTVEDAYHVLEGLRTVQQSAIARPLVLSLEKGSILSSSKGVEGHVRVKVTDIFEKFATPAKVYLVKAHPVGSEDKVILANQEVHAANEDPKNVYYHINFLGAKPDQGFYSLEFRVVPAGNQADKYGTIEATTRTVKVVGFVTLSDFQLSVAESREGHKDVTEGSKYNADYPNKIEEPIRIHHVQHVKIQFRVRNVGGSGRPLLVQQAFVKFTHVKTGHQAVFVAKPNENKIYTLQISMEEVAKTHFRSLSGDYRVEVLVGDAFIQNPLVWPVASVNVQFVTPAVEAESHGPLPEIKHKFREPEKRPSRTISDTFTAIVLSPILFLLVGLLVNGANIRRFPFSGVDFIFALGFIASFGAILLLMPTFWIKLNMVQTLGYLIVLSLPTIAFGQRALSYVASKKEKSHSQ